MSEFIKCGFEFTATLKKDSKVTNKGLYIDMGFSWRNKVQYSTLQRRTTYKLTKYQWISDNFDNDNCGCEVATPIIESEENISKYYKEFIKFVKRSNLTINIKDSIEGLGGCHIHMNLQGLNRHVKTRFLRNIGIFFTNYPELNWGFNEIQDNWNANSLLSYRMWQVPSNNLFKEFIINPLVSLNKDYAFRYNQWYDTIEFRIFDMPQDLKQHILHYDIAKAIYNYCMDFALRKKYIRLNYEKYEDYVLDLTTSIYNFKLAISDLNIDHKRTSKMIDNIKERYKLTTKKENLLL